MNQRGEVFTGKHSLTAFADYKIPQVLRKLGILEYSSILARSIQSKEEILAGSSEEVEIRAGMIWAIEEIRQAVEKHFPEIIVVEIDNYLWMFSQDHLSPID